MLPSVHCYGGSCQLAIHLAMVSFMCTAPQLPSSSATNRGRDSSSGAPADKRASLVIREFEPLHVGDLGVRQQLQQEGPLLGLGSPASEVNCPTPPSIDALGHQSRPRYQERPINIALGADAGAAASTAPAIRLVSAVQPFAVPHKVAVTACSEDRDWNHSVCDTEASATPIWDSTADHCCHSRRMRRQQSSNEH